ncbi:MAG: response regulator [Lachnospiraceae bacterium]|jgi:PAS domain S-box-containing protein|nr:response regulator [Lachnospiraceae bacterium]
MSSQMNADHHLIEQILSTLCTPEEGHRREKTTSVPSQDFRKQTALELKAFMDEMPGGFFIYHADGNEEILYANKAMVRLYNCSSLAEFRELTGNSFRGLVHPEDLEAVEASIWEQISESKYDLDYVEYRIIQKGGEIRWVEDYGHFLRSESAGDLFYVFIGDATEKRAQQNEEQLRRLEVIEGLSSNYESILYVDLKEDSILPYRMSPRAMQLFGDSFRLRSFQWFRLDYVNTWVSQKDREQVAKAMDPARIQGSLSSSDAYYVNYQVEQNGETQYYQLRIAGVGSQIPVTRAVLGFRRVDEEIRHEIEQKKLFEDALNDARLANLAKNNFLANMSHDIRTPLNALLGFITLARDHMTEPEKLGEYLGRIQTSSELLLSLFNDILEISRMESGSFQTEEIPCCLSDLIRNVNRDLSPRAEKKQLSLSADFSGLTHPDVYSDPDKLKEILMCLGTNAIKYTQAGGQVRISIVEQKAPSNNYAAYAFTVEDTGVGIAKGDLNRIFDPFERIKNTTFSGVHGTGLGLTIVRRLVDIMDGTISVESEPGQGSRFTVTLNLRIQDQKAFQPKTAQELLLKRMGERRILLVDDNDLNLELESELLEDLGFHVDTAMDGRMALEQLTGAAPDRYALVLMDIQMPVMNGYEAAQLIRSQEDPILRRIPIVALSANAFDEDRRMSRRSGMNAHMAKPLNTDQLLELMVDII